ncbi:MAG: hypothetical protein JXD19_04310, partial [Deltaproteobacteria bacterium]|nr:hypothetical protein [Deltaproteobacteria bacterium]
MKPKTLRPTIYRTLFVINLLVLSISSLPSPGLAGDPAGWDDLGLYGGQMYAIVVDPTEPSTLFAGSYYGDGLFKSTNAGESWESVEGFRNQIIYDIAFAPGDHQTIWVATIYYIYKSEDGGLSWTVYDPAWYFGNFQYYYSLALAPVNGNILYVGTSGLDGSNEGGSVYKTADGGETWEFMSLVADHNVWDIAIHPTNIQEIWAVTGPDSISEGTIYQTRNGGAAWTEIQTGLSKGWLDFVAINPTNPAIVFVGGEKGLIRTINGGSTWSQLQPNGSCRAFVFDPVTPKIVATSWLSSDGTDTFISKSTNNGSTWSTYSLSGLEFLSLVTHPETGSILYGGEGSMGIFKSDDGGETWTYANQGIKANQVYESTVSSASEIVAGTQAGIFIKEDGSWRWLNALPGKAVAFNPGDGNTMYAGSDDGFGMIHLDGSGSSFVYIPSNDPLVVSSLAAHPHNPAILYAGVAYRSGEKGEIYKSSDGGATVTLLRQFEKPVNAVAVNPSNPEILFAGTGAFYIPAQPGGIFKSLDGGATWEA